jgi:hypothetical protein
LFSKGSGKGKRWEGERGRGSRCGGVATARGQGKILQGLIHMKQRKKEIFGLQSNQIVKRRKLRKKLLKKKLRRRTKEEKIEQKGGEHNRTALWGVFLSHSNINNILTCLSLTPKPSWKMLSKIKKRDPNQITQKNKVIAPSLDLLDT